MNCAEQNHLAELVNPLNMQPNVRVTCRPQEEKQLTTPRLWCMIKKVATDMVMNVSFDVCEIATINIEVSNIVL